MLKIKNHLKYMDGFQSVLQCFLDLQFGSAKFYDELLKISFELFNTKCSQTNTFTNSAASALNFCRSSIWVSDCFNLQGMEFEFVFKS